jgi:hypothetical protein
MVAAATVMYQSAPTLANASSYDVSFVLDDASLGKTTVTGTIVTACDSCVLDPTVPDITSFSFTFSGLLNGAFSGASSNVAGTSPYPLLAASGAISYTDAGGAERFSASTSFGPDLVIFGSNEIEFGFISGTTTIIFTYGSSDFSTPFRIATETAAVPGPSVGAGLPGLVFAGGALLVGWRRRRPTV